MSSPRASRVAVRFAVSNSIGIIHVTTKMWISSRIRFWVGRCSSSAPWPSSQPGCRPAAPAGSQVPSWRCGPTECRPVVRQVIPGYAHGGPVPQLTLPGFEPAVGGCPSWLLWLYDQAGGESLAQGRGAPWALRLFVGVLLHVSVRDRDGSWRSLRFETDEVVCWLHPRGWSNRRRDWARLPDALEAMKQIAYVPVPGIGSVALLFPSVIPRLSSDPLVEFTVRIPSSAARGARIDWRRLCRYGADSAALYRAYLSVCATMDGVAFKGAPITRRIGAPVLNSDGQPRRRQGGAIVRRSDDSIPHPRAAMAPVWTDEDAARFIGWDPTNRFRRRDARGALERLSHDRVIDLERLGDGRFRLFGGK